MGSHKEDLSGNQEDPGEHTDFASDRAVSSEHRSGAESQESTFGDDEFEDGFDVQTHEGGQLEEISGFNIQQAMVGAFGQLEEQAVDHDLWRLPRSCDIEYGNEPESVCGADDRVHVTQVTQVPWRMICQLVITLQDGRRSRCTGWFISPTSI